MTTNEQLALEDEISKLTDMGIIIDERALPASFARGSWTALTVQPELSIKGQQWYRGVRELFVQENFSGLKEFVDCYRPEIGGGIEQYINLAPTAREAIKHFFSYFSNNYRKA